MRDPRLKLAREVYYRGQARGVAPAKPDAGADPRFGIHDYGDGLYVTSDHELARRYASERAGKDQDLQEVLRGNLERADLGKVLDLNADARWAAYVRKPTWQAAGKQGPTPEDLLKLATGNESYWKFFQEFLASNDLRLEDYDAIIGPEYVRGGTQVCLRTAAVQARARAALKLYEAGANLDPVSDGGSSGPVGGKPGGGGSSGGGGASVPLKTRATAGVALAALTLNKVFNWVIDAGNEKRLRARQLEVDKQLQASVAENPHLGYLLVYEFSGGADSGEGPTASSRFETIHVVKAPDEVSARAAWSKQSSYAPNDRTYDSWWIDPPDPTFDTPWPVYGAGKFVVGAEIRFQNVQFKEGFRGHGGGFDTDGQSIELDGTRDRDRWSSYRFQILQMPAQVTFNDVNHHAATIGVDLDENVVAGGTVPVVMLDGQPAVAAMAADAATEELFAAAKKINDWGRLAHFIPSIYRVRWLRPEHVELIPNAAQAQRERARLEAVKAKAEQERSRREAEEAEQREQQRELDETPGAGQGSRSG